MCNILVRKGEKMLKRKWVVATAVIALLVLGVTGGTLLAQEAGGDDSGRKSLADRVADILGLDSGDVKAAFSEAQRDIADERLETKLDMLVAKEIIDQAKADEILAWFKTRPDGIPARLLGGGHKKGGFGGKFGHKFDRIKPDDPTARFFGRGESFTGPQSLFQLPGGQGGPLGDDDIRARILERFQLLIPPDAQDS